MASSQRPGRKTVSRSSLETERCTHVFEAAGYSLHRGLPAGQFIESTPFAVGGHRWSLRYFPNGDGEKDSEGHVSLFVDLLSKPTEVRILFDFRLVDTATGVSSSVHKDACTFSSLHLSWRAGDLMERSEIESYVRDDLLVIECDLTVIVGTPVSKSVCGIQVPPSVLVDNLGELLASEEGADVTFKVEDKVFPAHKVVLAMRSPVFKAELYGPMSEKSTESITIEDMQPAVFKALLHFIYKDSLPAMDDLDAGENEEMVKHLLVAADRYGIERLKVMCESILGKRLDVESVATTLALADQHHCSQLKDACIGFINSSNRLDDVVASQGYAHLKRACPTAIVEIWEKSVKSRKV
ncbi:hypothetical protein ACP70R_003274 [Stipagrostis hirtigluma subsp. patula]